MNRLPRVQRHRLLGRGCALPIRSSRSAGSQPAADYESDIAIEWKDRASQSPRRGFDENNPCLAPNPPLTVSAGEVGALTVTAGSGAVWNATTNSPWLTISSAPWSGQPNRVLRGWANRRGSARGDAGLSGSIGSNSWDFPQR